MRVLPKSFRGMVCGQRRPGQALSLPIARLRGDLPRRRSKPAPRKHGIPDFVVKAKERPHAATVKHLSRQWPLPTRRTGCGSVARSPVYGEHHERTGGSARRSLSHGRPPEHARYLALPERSAAHDLPERTRPRPQTSHSDYLFRNRGMPSAMNRRRAVYLVPGIGLSERPVPRRGRPRFPADRHGVMRVP